MNNYSKIDERLNMYINIMKNIDDDMKNQLLYGCLGDLKSIAENFNKTSNVRVKSIVVQEGQLLVFGVISSYLINTCNKENRSDILTNYRAELERVFALYCTDGIFIDKPIINKKIKEQGVVNIEYSELITSMFLNSAVLLACKAILAPYITDIEDALNHIGDYLATNYLCKLTENKTKHILID